MAANDAVVEERIKSVQTNVDDLRHQVRKLDDKVAVLSENVVELDKRVIVLDAKVDTLGNRVGALDCRVGRLEDRVGRLEHRVGMLEDRVVKLDEKVDALGVRLEMKTDALAAEDKEIRKEMAKGFETVNARIDNVVLALESMRGTVKATFLIASVGASVITTAGVVIGIWKALGWLSHT